jgi:hypothetical protein
MSSAGFYAENLLLYSEQAKADGVLPLPIGESHKFAPVALGVSLTIFPQIAKRDFNRPL